MRIIKGYFKKIPIPNSNSNMQTKNFTALNDCNFRRVDWKKEVLISTDKSDSKFTEDVTYLLIPPNSEIKLSTLMGKVRNPDLSLIDKNLSNM